MPKIMARLINSLKNLFQPITGLKDVFKVGQAVRRTGGPEQEFLDQVRWAHRDWQIALKNFDYAVDPDLIDYAIYNIEATEKMYVCLIKRARKENLRADLPFNEPDPVMGLPPA